MTYPLLRNGTGEFPSPFRKPLSEAWPNQIIAKFNEFEMSSVFESDSSGLSVWMSEWMDVLGV